MLCILVMYSCLELETTHVTYLGTVDQTPPRNQSNIHPIGPSNSSPEHIDICGGTLHVHEVDHSKQAHLMAFNVVLSPPSIESIEAEKLFPPLPSHHHCTLRSVWLSPSISSPDSARLGSQLLDWHCECTKARVKHT